MQLSAKGTMRHRHFFFPWRGVPHWGLVASGVDQLSPQRALDC